MIDLAEYNAEPSISVRLPTEVEVSKKKKFTLNLNEYRNAHFRVLAKAKLVFAEKVKALLKDNEIKVKDFIITYQYFSCDKRKKDTGNVICIVDKFFSDAIVEIGIAEDDNYFILPHLFFFFGGIDKEAKKNYVIANIYEKKENL